MPYPFAPPLDPTVRGVRIVVQNALGAAIIDATIPGGLYDPLTQQGWRINTTRTVFSYRHIGDLVPKIQGLKRVVIFDRAARDPGRLKFGIQGRGGTYPLTPAESPIRATVIFDVPSVSTGQCADAIFPGPSPTPECTFVTPAFVVCR